VSAAGNHEFDQGWEDLRDRVQAVVYAYETGLVIPSQGLDF